MEVRNPDPSTNPYLTLALFLAAGLDGIRNQIMPPEAVNLNMFKATEEELRKMQVQSLPTSLKEAIQAFREDTFVQGVLGERISQKFISTKTKEWESYRRQVSKWEIEQYLYKI